jgi:hypothetical protein
LSEQHEYKYHMDLKSGARVVSDPVEVDNDPYNDSIVTVVNNIARWAEGKEDGVFKFPVNQNLTYVPFRSIEFISLEYVIAGERGSSFPESDSEYVFEGQ